MKGIRKRGASYVCDVTLDGRRKTGTAPSYDEAVELRSALRRELRGEVVELPKVMKAAWTLYRAFEVARQTKWSGKHAENSIRNAEAFLQRWGRHTPIERITTEHLDVWTAELADAGNSDATINRKLATVSTLMTVAIERGGLQAKPKIPKRREGRGRLRYLLPEEEAAVLKTMRGWGWHREAEAVTVLIDTGMRLGELLRLQVRDVDLKQGLVHIWDTKNGEPRSVPMTKRVRVALATNMVDGQDRLFPYTNSQMDHLWARVRGHLGLGGDRQFVLHALRHTCASRLVQAGVSIPVVQQWLGHKTITVTMRYAHLAPTQLMDAVSALEQKV